MSMGKKGRRVKTEAKTYKGTLDEVLSTKNLWRKPMPKDGSCLFRAVSEQVYELVLDSHVFLCL